MISETDIEKLAIKQLVSKGYEYLSGPLVSPDSDAPERNSYQEVILEARVRRAVYSLNPKIPDHAKDQAIRQILHISSPELVNSNEIFHKYLTEGVDVEFQKQGITRGDKVWLVDFKNPKNNEFLAINQFTVVENNVNKRLDIVLFINGIPLVVMELKNPIDERATLRKAFNQIQTYKASVPSIFAYNALNVISDGLEARAGSLSAGFSRFHAWKTNKENKNNSRVSTQLEIMVNGLLDKNTLLDIIRHFTVFERSKKQDPKTGQTFVETIKKIAAFHQYYAVNKAVSSTIKAVSEKGAGKAGVMWHTQGSGKSLSMVFYAGKLVLSLDNPTLVVLTDRNDLDDQLFDTFASCNRLLRQEPHQAKSRQDLRKKLKVASGGIVFTTIQKFFPEDQKPVYPLLSERENIVVIADEAHRSQYGFKAKQIDKTDEKGTIIGKRTAYGLAKYLRDALPNATFIGFTGTPIEFTDRNTPRVFGKYIDIYDVAQAQGDHATVKIFYESRLAKVGLDDKGRKLIQELDKELSEGDLTIAQKAKAKWTKLEAIVGNPSRIKNVAQDALDHFEKRREVFEGKAMFVAMSRRIALDVYNEITRMKPKWHHKDWNKGCVKLVMTVSSHDGPEFNKHNYTKEIRRQISNRFKDPKDPLAMVVVCDMWLTGFDVPCLHTMYMDKPIKGHNLMQAIARVNRIYLDKPGGLIVDYIGFASDLKKALAFYAESGGKGTPADTQEVAVNLMLEKLEKVEGFFKGFNYKKYFTSKTAEKLSLILKAEEHILQKEQGKENYIKEVTLLSRAFSLCVPHEAATTR